MKLREIKLYWFLGFFSMSLQNGCFEMCDIYSGNFNKFAVD